MNNHEMIYLKLRRGKTNPLLNHVDDTSTYLSIGGRSPMDATKEIESHLDYWRSSIGDITEIEIKDFRSNLSVKILILDNHILNVETLAKEIADLRLEIFEELNGDIEL